MKDVAVKVKGTTRKYEIIIVTVCADENGMFQRNGSIAAKAAGYEPIT